MANQSSRSSILHGLMEEAGVPVESISVQNVNATPPAVTVTYKAEATAEQIALGDQMLAAFDWRKRKALDRNTVVTAFNQLTTAQQNQALRHVVMDGLRNNPALVAKVNAALGVSLVVDEVDPN